MDIPRKLMGIFLLFNQYRPVSPLEKVTGAVSFDIEIGAIRSIDMVQNLRKIASGGFKQEVIMIV
jgi:hypothetical protein